MSGRVAAKKVPWHSWDEWLQVARIIRDGPSLERRSACRIIRLWSSRGKLPIAVELTRNIIEAELLDADLSSLADEHSRYEDANQILNLAYGLAISRFVNLMTDVVQKGAVAVSMDTLANSVDIPSWIVQIRHNAIHGASFPSVDLMRKAAVYLLNDLIIPKYWNAQHDLLIIPCAKPEVDDFVPASVPVQTPQSITQWFGGDSEPLIDDFPTHLRVRLPEIAHWTSTHMGMMVDETLESGAAMLNLRIMLSSLDDRAMKVVLAELLRQNRTDVIAATIANYECDWSSVIESLVSEFGCDSSLMQLIDLVMDGTRTGRNPNIGRVQDKSPLLCYSGEAFRYVDN